MAKLKKWTALAVIMISLLSSCTTEEIYPTEYMYPESFTKDYTVYTDKNKSLHWKVAEDSSGPYFYCEIKEPKLTDEVYDLGAIQAFLFLGDLTLSPLPFNDYLKDENDGYLWTEQITFEFSPGIITFILKPSDHVVNNPPKYPEYSFKVRFVW